MRNGLFTGAIASQRYRDHMGPRFTDNAAPSAANRLHPELASEQARGKWVSEVFEAVEARCSSRPLTCSRRSAANPGEAEVFRASEFAYAGRLWRRESSCYAGIDSARREPAFRSHSAPKALTPTAAETIRAPAPHASRAMPNNHGADACAMRAGTMRTPCRWP